MKRALALLAAPALATAAARAQTPTPVVPPPTLEPVPDAAPAPGGAKTAPPLLPPASVLAAAAGNATNGAPGTAAPDQATGSTQVSWSKHYPLGPGDILDVGIYGLPDLERTGLMIQPDGTISYLQAQNIHVAGLTIDEARAALTAQLSRYYKHLFIMVWPNKLQSKRYYLMGKVAYNGTYPLDRPMTIIEAVARAGGLAIGEYEGNTVELADMSHAFLLRRHQMMKVDFKKLFYDGDLSQNLELEPEDYIYIPSNLNSEVFVLGAVGSQGMQGMTSDLTLIGAITRRGGFGNDAYRERVLVVRGSLTHPQTFVVNTDDILKGHAPDFRLEPKDIVYVHAHPWRYADELLDTAVSAFITGAVTTWTGESIHRLVPEFIPKADIHR